MRGRDTIEFLGLPEDKPIMESDLEKVLVKQTEKFLLELGWGVCLLGPSREYQSKTFTNNERSNIR